MPTYPNVPDLPGVPSIPRNPAGSSVNTSTQVDINGSVGNRTSPAKWGIYTAKGAVVLTPDSFIQLGYGKEYALPSYPIEEGAFDTYNKVARPFIGSIAISVGGTESSRGKFITALDALVASMELYTLVTPERSYTNVNFFRLEYDRGPEHGAAMIVAELRYQEIRTSASTQFVYTPEAVFTQNTVAQPSGADPKDTGHVQTQAPDKSQLNAFGPNAGVG